MFWLMACSVPETLTTRKIWESIIILDDESILMLRFSQGNTGILRQQSALRTVRFSETTPPQEYLLRGRERDTTFDDMTIKIGSQRVTHDDGWNISIRDAFFNIQANINKEGQNEPVTLWADPDWTSLLHGFLLPTQGWIQINDFSGPIFGQAVIFEHMGHRVHEEGHELWIIEGANTSLIIEQSSKGTFYFSPENNSYVEIEDQVQEEASLSLQEGILHFKKATSLGSIDPYEHVTAPERLLISPFFPTPNLRVSRGYVEVERDSIRQPSRFLRIQKSSKDSD